MILTQPIEKVQALRRAIQDSYLADEESLITGLVDQPFWLPGQQASIKCNTEALISAVRKNDTSRNGIDSFLGEYDLSSQEGVMLMCLAEALLRIPDRKTADRLLHDKLVHADWASHVGNSSSWLVNAGTWGLLLTGRLLRLDENDHESIAAFLRKIIVRRSETVVRAAMKEAMRILAEQFVMGQDIDAALQQSQSYHERGYLFSYDMLGETALTENDAERYFSAYSEAVKTLSLSRNKEIGINSAAGISVKLSALHPRFEFSQRQRIESELVPRVLQLAQQARDAGISLTLDAEESWRLEPTLDVFESVFRDSSLKAWHGFGIAVQAYQKRALLVINWLANLAEQQSKPVMLRLVKGAYWDTEIKRAQELGLSNYPVFTRKQSTDVSYMACARRIFSYGDAFYPQFATHNAHSLAAIIELAGDNRKFEFQRLHGMGEDLYDALAATEKNDIPVRIYAPVGNYKSLLPYLVRRLLENGSNSSFVNRLVHKQKKVDELLLDPVDFIRAIHLKHGQVFHPDIPLPENLFGKERKNSSAINLENIVDMENLSIEIGRFSAEKLVNACPLIAGERCTSGNKKQLYSPLSRKQLIGTVITADQNDVEEALRLADLATADWRRTGVEARTKILNNAAELIETHRAELMCLIIREGGRCIPDALSEVREAIDYCRYYAVSAEKILAAQELAGPTGERNTLSLHGRGIFVTISPWNFPLAIFTGQIVAALVAGNTVIAKPASQAPLVAFRMIELLHQAGVPANVLHFLPGNGEKIGACLFSDSRLSGVAFTGSTETAKIIERTLAEKQPSIIPFIAETGGLNTMIADSSAQLEQLVTDIVQSAFNSAGQRCSSLRVLFVQKEIADRTVLLLQGVMTQLSIGDPTWMSTDIGPLIGEEAKKTVLNHCEKMKQEALSYFECSIDNKLSDGFYVGPVVIEISRLDQLRSEVFGPVLHLIRYDISELDEVITQINNSDYGLTLGIHSRIDTTIDYIRQRVQVGNIYVNRNMIGAVVGVQPFGGQGLSGTGPKAGGPLYLQRFCNERCISENTAAVGGNADLLSMGEIDD